MALDHVPARLRAGETLSLLFDLSPDYPASTWTLKLYLRRPGADIIELDATASGSQHAVTALAADTADYSPGRYSFVGRVANGAVSADVMSGEVEILGNPADDAHDPRTFAETMRDACEKLIAGRVLDAHELYTVKDTAVTKSSRAELQAEYVRWKRKVAQERGIDASRAVVTYE